MATEPISDASDVILLFRRMTRACTCTRTHIRWKGAVTSLASLWRCQSAAFPNAAIGYGRETRDHHPKHCLDRKAAVYAANAVAAEAGRIARELFEERR